MYKENFSNVLNKIDNVIEAWSRRSSTPIGCITVINSLINSLLVHRMMALPTPPKEFFTTYKKKITNFIWGSKAPTIPYNKLIQDHQHLGLKLCDLELKNLALKVTWPIRWMEREDMDWIYEFLPITNNSIWECNTDPRDVAKMVSTDFSTLDVTGSIWLAWTEFNYQPTIDNAEEILNLRLIGNSLIRKINKPIFDAYLSQENLERVIDLVNIETKNVMTYTEIIATLRIKIDFVTYLGLIAAIPKIWKTEIHAFDFDMPLDITPTINQIASKGNFSKNIYWAILEKKFPVTDTLHIVMQNTLATQIESDECWNLYPNFIKNIRPSKLRYFQ